MLSYFIRRFLLIPPTFLGITLLVFCITRLVPGGPVERMIQEAQARRLQEGGAGAGRSEMGTQSLSEDQINQLKEYYGFDKPVLVSYGQWLWKVLQFDLGTSTRYTDPVWDTIKERMPVSFFYGFMTMILSYLFCIPLGVIKAVRHGSLVDKLSSFVVFLGYAMPSYVIAIIFLVLFCSQLSWFPMGGFVSDGFAEMSLGAKIVDILHHAILPLSTYMIGSLAVMTFVMKNSLLDNLASDYMRTAMAKGCTFRQAVWRHAFRNSLIPLATNFGNNIAFMLSGSFLVEKIFNIDGFGLLGYESIIERDYPVVMGVLVIGSLLLLVGNILSDLCVALVDPRVQFR